MVDGGGGDYDGCDGDGDDNDDGDGDGDDDGDGGVFGENCALKGCGCTQSSYENTCIELFSWNIKAFSICKRFYYSSCVFFIAVM